MYLQANQACHLLRRTVTADNSAEIKRRPRAAGYKNAKIMTPFVHAKWTLLTRISPFCLPSRRVFYRNKGYARRDGKRCLSYGVAAFALFALLKGKNCRESEGSFPPLRIDVAHRRRVPDVIGRRERDGGCNRDSINCLIHGGSINS